MTLTKRDLGQLSYAVYECEHEGCYILSNATADDDLVFNTIPCPFHKELAHYEGHIKFDNVDLLKAIVKKAVDTMQPINNVMIPCDTECARDIEKAIHILNSEILKEDI